MYCTHTSQWLINFVAHASHNNCSRAGIRNVLCGSYPEYVRRKEEIVYTGERSLNRWPRFAAWGQPICVPVVRDAVGTAIRSRARTAVGRSVQFSILFAAAICSHSSSLRHDRRHRITLNVNTVHVCSAIVSRRTYRRVRYRFRSVNVRNDFSRPDSALSRTPLVRSVWTRVADVSVFRVREFKSETITKKTSRNCEVSASRQRTTRKLCRRFLSIIIKKVRGKGSKLFSKNV